MWILMDMLLYDVEVIGVVCDFVVDVGFDSVCDDFVVCVVGMLLVELYKLWCSGVLGNYYMDYVYLCMGYEVVGGFGVKFVWFECEVIVIVGDGLYMMFNVEFVIFVMFGCKLIVVIFDNCGYGCIEWL